MDRAKFTIQISKLIICMYLKNERPLLDWVKRSAEEQRRMFDKELSKCDGTEKTSAHQLGQAADIYFLSEDGKGIGEPKHGWKYWHERWEGFGGKPMIVRDKGHFE